VFRRQRTRHLPPSCNSMPSSRNRLTRAFRRNRLNPPTPSTRPPAAIQEAFQTDCTRPDSLKILSESAPDLSMKSNPISVVPRDVDPLSLTGFLPGPRTQDLTQLQEQRAHAHLPIAIVQWRSGGSLNGVGAHTIGACAFLDSGTDFAVFYKADVRAAWIPLLALHPRAQRPMLRSACVSSRL
jgi:hypothetical protein